jgi:FKBP-type peptidyl-prolyl cis-trans isomerase
MKNTMFKVIASLACAVVLAACGGGVKTDPVAPLPPQPVFTKTDVATGTGDKSVAVGDLVALHYTAYLYDETKSDKKGAQFLTTRTTADTAPSVFTVGVGTLIAGVDQGLIGMKVGGKRNLLIPSSMAFGPVDKVDATGKVVVPANTAVVYDVEVFTITTLQPLTLFSKLDTTVGTGTEAAANNLVTVNYTGYIYDDSKADKKGTQFETGTSFTFLLGVNSRIGGWELGIPQMKTGGKRTLYIPSGLAYAQWGRKDSAGNYVVPTNTAVVYDIELTAVNTSPPTSTVQPDYKKIDDQVGVGAAAVTGNTVLVQYSGYLYNDSVTDKKGLRFDTSRVTGTPFSVTLGAGKVIKGWEDGLVGMQAGGRRTLIIPASLAYGSNAQTNIPANSALVFEIEVISITQ